MLPVSQRLRHACTVSDRVVGRTIRGLVVTATVAAITAAIGAHVVLSHDSGTYFGLLVFLPLLVAPAALVWHWPEPRYLAGWAASGWIATIIWSIAGTPYRYERELPAWTAVSTPLWIAIGLVLFVVPMIGLLAMKHERVPRALELFAARLRRIVLLTLGLAMLVIIASLAVAAGQAFVVAFFAAMLVVPGLLAFRDPRPRWAWMWATWCAPFPTFGVWLWFAFGSSSPWLARVLEIGFGTMFVLLLIGLPTICITTPLPAFTGSAARARYRSHSR